jgi:CheY-like chemotaxis protein
MKITVLIADDEPLNQLLLAKISEQLGYSIVIAGDGEEAVQKFKEHHPDLVLMDIMMPRLNGLEATAAIKQLSSEQWVPVIMLSALSDQTNIVAAIKAGAEDYLVKPLQVDVLKAKLAHYEHALQAERQLREQNNELRRYQFQSEDEKRIASHLMSTLIDVERIKRPGVAWWLKPADAFSGDVLACSATPAGTLHVMLADGTGHGLAAALSAQPLPDIFYAMTARGYCIASIAQEINRRVGRMLPVDRFFAATLVAIDPQERTLEVWNGGNPDAMLVAADGTIAHAFKSRHLPLGIIRHGVLGLETERVQYAEGMQLLVSSDGLLEAFPEAREQALPSLLAMAPPAQRMAHIQATVAERLQGEPTPDDISLFLIDIDDIELSLAVHEAGEAQPVKDDEPPEWSSEVEMFGRQLQRNHQEAVPKLMSMLAQMQSNPGESFHPGLFLVFAELFNNSLDHGLLRLDSRIKEEEGFEAYLEARAARLEQLSPDAMIAIRVDMRQGGHMHIRLRDSGSGFDYRAVETGAEERYSGRGLALVRSMCARLEFSGAGNEVLAVLAPVQSR